jgi:hypothetical protein
MKHLHRKLSLGTLVLALAGWILWQFSALQPVIAISTLSNPAKLATLGERGANPRLNKIVYWLHEAEEHGLAGKHAVDCAQLLNRTGEPRAGLVKASLLRNLRIAKELGLFTPENLVRLRQGKAGLVTRGPYADSLVAIDHIVPFSMAKEVGNELANLEMLPERLNLRKSNRVGERQLAHARRLHEAGLLSAQSLVRVEAQASRR